MKKTIFFVLTLTLIAIFCFPGQLKGTNKNRFLIEKHQPGAIQTITPENAREKRERYLWLKKQRQKWASQCPVTSQVQSTDSPRALDIDIRIVDGSVYLQPDDDGYVCMTGLCTNTGSDQAFFIFVSVKFSDGGGTPLGTDVGMAVGGRNVQVPTEDGVLCLDTLVDGVNLGHPTYNIHRADIAALFPGYANTDGAAGYFVLDTTAYEDGVHTIQWTVTDSGGDTDGIGSRYFNIVNGGIDTDF